MSHEGLVVEFSVPRPKKRQEEKPTPKDTVPRIARLLALGWKWELAVRRGEVKNYKDIARLMNLTPARVTQIANLTLLAADLQEEVLLANETSACKVAEHRLRPIYACARWSEQQYLCNLCTKV